MLAVATLEAGPVPAPVRSRLAALATLIAAGDLLLFRREPGLALVVFAALVEMATVATSRCAPRRAAACALIALATLAPLMEDVTTLGVLFALGGAAAVALLSNDALRGPLEARLARGLAFVAFGPFQILRDAPACVLQARDAKGAARAGLAWVLPVALGGVFLVLFREANPILEQWLDALNWAALWALLDKERLAFWLLLLAGLWPFLHVRPRARAASAQRLRAPSSLAPLLDERAILRALVLFNLLFALQTGLDAAILWGGRGLPEGVTFAAYAHRGAYPLVVTALLAGAFVVLAMRSTAAQRPLVRALLWLWTAQNLALVVSSTERLKLYVETYSLTYWRVAAFVWMGLVGAGLVLIFAQEIGKRSTRWLIGANLIAATLTLYVCAFVNFAGLIAAYDLSHCAQTTPGAAALDLEYLSALGPDALPALDAARHDEAGLFEAYMRNNSTHVNDVYLLEQTSWWFRVLQSQRARDWGAFTFRRWRLSRYIANTPEKP